MPPRKASRKRKVEEIISNLTEEEIREHVEEFESHPADWLRAQADFEDETTKFEKDMDYLTRCSRAGAGILHHYLSRNLEYSTSVNDPIIRLLNEKENFLVLINDLGQVPTLSEEDRKAIRLVMMKVLNDLYQVVNPTKLNEVPKLILKYEKGFGTSNIILTEENTENPKTINKIITTVSKKVGWYSMFETLWDKYEDQINIHRKIEEGKDKPFDNEKAFQLIKSSLIKNNSLITQTMKTFLEDLLFNHFVEENGITQTRHILTIFASFPDIFNINFTRPLKDSTSSRLNEVTLLYIAVSKGFSDIINILIQRGCDTTCLDSLKNDIVAIASKFGKAELLLFLLKKHHFDVNQKNADEDTPLHQAIRAGHNKVTAILLSNGADRTLKSKRGKTALEELEDTDHLIESVKIELKRLLTLADVSSLSLTYSISSNQQEKEEEEGNDEGNDDENEDEDDDNRS